MKHKALATAIAVVFAVPLVASGDEHEPAPATDEAMALEEEVMETFSVDIGGQISRGVYFYDTNAAAAAAAPDTLTIADGEASTRVNFNGSIDLDGVNTVQTQLEYGLGSTATLRHANIQFRGPFGAVTLGQGSEAGDGVAYTGSSGVPGLGHGATYKGLSLDNPVTEVSFFPDLGTGGRKEMIKYETPALLTGLSAAVSVSEGSATEGDRVSAALGISPAMEGITASAKIGMLSQEFGADTFNAGFGVTMGNGIIIAGAYGQQDGGTDPEYFQAELGYKLTDNTTIGASWYGAKDTGGVAGSDATAYGIGVNHAFPKFGAVYISTQRYSVDFGGEEFRATGLVIGTVVKF
jgi:hypothetical protein